MRLCSFLDGGRPRLGRVAGELVHPLRGRDVADAIVASAPETDEAPRLLAEVELLAPLRPPKLIGIGHNSRDHAAEAGVEPPSEPRLFAKLTSSVTAPGGPVVHPGWTGELDYEGELAVVIGRRTRRVPPRDALASVFGYAVIDDVTARDLQRAEGNWVRAKGGDTFGPLGPWVTTADEIDSPQSLRIRTWVNGDLRQDGTTADMVFGVAELIAFVSDHLTLEPGDVLATGTPAGVGAWAAEARHLVPGDRVRIEIDGLGSIEHDVVAGG
jgi:5-carboxymethyl-2-hydroxymuconate isomerase